MNTRSKPKHSINELVIVECTGEAHSNPYIDHCYECMPYWKYVPVCPYCRTMIPSRKPERKSVACPGCGCRYHYEPTQEKDSPQ